MLIIYRVALGRAWSKSSMGQISGLTGTTATQIRFATPKNSKNGSSSKEGGTFGANSVALSTLRDISFGVVDIKSTSTYASQVVTIDEQTGITVTKQSYTSSSGSDTV